MEKRVYKAPEIVTDKEAIDAIKNNVIEVLIHLPIDLSFNHDNWKFIQDICVRLSEHDNPLIRANSILGLAHTARFKGRLEKNIVKPILLRALKDSDPTVVSNAETAISDINEIMGWHIGGAKRQKELEARFNARKK